jgi:Uma2 family endonuclease
MKVAEEKAPYGKKRLTVDAFLERYGHIDDGNVYELHEGEVVVVPPPGAEHGELHSILNYILQLYGDSQSGLRFFDGSGVQFSKDTFRGPDVTVVKASDPARIENGKIIGTPSLVIEIVSPNKPRLDLVRKLGLYTKHNVPEIWLLDSQEEEALFLMKHRKSADYDEQRLSSGIFESKVLKGFKLDVAALFALDKKRLRKVLESK